MSRFVVKVFIFIVIASVFSLTVQATIIHYCQDINFKKERCLLEQSALEEEADTEENDELMDDIVLVNASVCFGFILQSVILLKQKHEAFNYTANFQKTPAPPPKYYC